MIVKPNATDVSTYFHLRLAADGTDATGLTITNFDLQYVRSGVAPTAKVDATALAATDSAHGDNQAIEIDATDQPGVYRVDWPDAAFASGVREVILTVKVATAFTESLRVQLQAVPADVTAIEGADPTDTIRDAVVDDATRIDASALNTASGTTIPAILDDTDLIDDATSGLAKIATDVAAVLVDTAVIGAAGAGLTEAGGDGDHLTAINLPNQTMDIVGNITGNLSGSVGSVTGAVGSVTGAVGSVTGAVGSVTGDVGGNVTGSVGSLATQAKADVNAEADAAIETYHLDHLLAVTYDPASKPGAADALLNELVESDAGVSRYTANALEQAPTGGSAPTAADIADAVWEEAIADHSGTAGSTAEALNAAGSAGDPWVTALPGAYGAGSAGKILGDNLNATVGSRASQTTADAIEADTQDLQSKVGTPAGVSVSADVAAVKSDTAATLTDSNELQTDWADGGRLDLILDGRASQTSVDDVPTNAELTTALTNLDAAVSTRATPAQVATELGTYDAPTKAELDAAVAALATAANLATVAGYLDTEIAAIKAVTDLLTAAQAEPSAAPAANATPLAKLAFLAALARNKITQTATTQTLRNDADSADIATAAVSDDATTFTRAEWQ